jgi:1,4-alpha-glucan branching enzyme
MGSWKHDEETGRFLSYVELADSLVDYVKEMGYTHIEMLPIEEHPFDGSWGYQVTGYYAPTSRYGNPAEFMYFVDKCHQAGIGVLLDWVPAHFPKDAHGLARFDGSALYEHEDPRQGEHPEWGTLIFNYGRNEVKNFLIANALYWIEKFHIDGLRVDAVASMLYLDYAKSEGQWVPNKYGGRENLDAVEFMKHMNSVIEKKHPEAYMIAEESTSWAGVSKSADEDGLGFSLKWNMGWMNDFLEYVAKDPIYRKFHHNNLTFGMVYAYTEKFVLVLSHDEVVHGKHSMLDKMPGDLWQKFANLRAAYGFMYGHPGKKLLFMGGEFGQFIEWNEKRPLDWFLLQYGHHQTMLNFVKDLNHLYLDNNALWLKDFDGDGFEWIDCNDNEKSIYSFIRRGEKKEDTLVFIVNFTPNTYEDFRVGVPFEGEYEEILNSDATKYGGSGVTNEGVKHSDKQEYNGREDSIGLRLAPLSVTVFKAK